MATADTTLREAPRRPRLRTINELAGERHASWLELFFDLIFVLAVSQVAQVFFADLSPRGFLHFALLSALVWWAWVGYSFYADRFEAEDTTYRLLTFAGMLGVAALAANIHGAFTDAGRAFALSYAATRAVLVVLYVRAAIYVPIARTLTVRVAAQFGALLVVWTASAFVAPPLRPWLWTAAILAEVATPFLNERATRHVPIDLTHIPERFGLFTLIVLGEVVVAVTNGVVGAGGLASAHFVALFGFGVSVAVWWINFEFVHSSRMRAQSPFARHVFLGSHYLSTIGIVAAGVGVNQAIRDATLPAVPLEVRLALCGGLALFLISVTANLVAARCGEPVATRLGSAATLVALALVGGRLSPLVLVALVCAALAIEVALESRRGTAAARSEEQADEPAFHCSHLNTLREGDPATVGCAECLAGKSKWVHLRLCLTCGHVGCCDSSPHRHATRHFEETGHCVMRSIEPGDSWVWCYVDQTFLAGEWIEAWTGSHVDAPDA